MRLCDYGAVCDKPLWHPLHLLSLHQEKWKVLTAVYARKDTRHTIANTASISVASFSEIEEMDKQVTLWENESISEKGSVAQNLKEKIRANEEKLNKLVSVFLDGDIPREMYLQRKDLLMREKAGLLESETNFGQQRKNWVEPLRSFVLSLKQAADLEKTSNHLEWKKFFQKIGSNPEIKDKTVSIRWGELWDFTASAVGERVLAKIKARFWLPQNRSLFLIPNKLLLVPSRGLEPPRPCGH